MQNPEQSPETILRGMRVITIALALGVVVFAIITMFLAATSTPEASTEDSLTEVLTYANLAMVLIVWPCAFWLRKKVELSAYKKGQGRIKDDETARFTSVMAGHLVHLSVLEGAALFGIVVCLFASMTGEIQSAPSLWINAVSAVAFLIFVFGTFPNQERVQKRARNIGHGK